MYYIVIIVSRYFKITCLESKDYKYMLVRLRNQLIAFHQAFSQMKLTEKDCLVVSEKQQTISPFQTKTILQPRQNKENCAFFNAQNLSYITIQLIISVISNYVKIFSLFRQRRYTVKHIAGIENNPCVLLYSMSCKGNFINLEYQSAFSKFAIHLSKFDNVVWLQYKQKRPRRKRQQSFVEGGRWHKCWSFSDNGVTPRPPRHLVTWHLKNPTRLVYKIGTCPCRGHSISAPLLGRFTRTSGFHTGG